ncbi:hypothetical protein MVEN_00663700 [Mycena venus]|uniref:Uncharacterized protein n=1 Tax=Mycena venus TaxID=2733690 RepID=A0A8H6YNA5_9AGAR|nr:hypothetical protein MVEN_00663700 [Mycena venus]
MYCCAGPAPPTAVAAPAPLTTFAPPPAPPAPNSAPPIPALAGVDPSALNAVIQLLAGSKRACEEDGVDDVRSVRQRAAEAVAVPDVFVWTPASAATTPPFGSSPSQPPLPLLSRL